jgi:pimeloyl-ACP methyl ester carboxylesterase
MIFSKPKTFDELFSAVPAEQKQQLLDFREQAAYKTIQVNGKPWRYRTFGSGEQAMVLLPGAFTLADIWMHTAQAFAQSYRLIIPDAYARQECYEAEKVCEVIRAMMDEEQAKKAVFIGLAAGGDMAQYFLHQSPEKVSHLVLSHCDILGDRPSVDEIRTRSTIRFYERSPESMIHSMMLRQLEKNLPTGSDWQQYTLAYYRDSIRGLKKKMVIEYVKQSHTMKKTFEYMAARIRFWEGRLLFLASEDDTLTLENITPLMKMYPTAKVHRFAEGQNHVHLLYPQQVNDVIRIFLENAEPKQL